MSRRTVLLALLLAAGPAAVPVAQTPPTPPNILFIISDDHRWDALGAAGNASIRTPALDALAREGVYFQQATIHTSQCAASRAVLLTGLPAHQNGYYSNQTLRGDLQWADRFRVPTVPELLQQAGYHTVLVGKWHLAVDPWKTGFADVRTWLPEAGADYVDAELARGNSRQLRVTKGFINQVFANDAIDFLRSPAARAQPFLLWLASTAPHAPYEPNPRHISEMYATQTAADLLPPGLPRDAKVDLALGIEQRGRQGSFAPYYEAVTHLDEQVGRVLAALAEQELADNTIVIFLGDNGLMAGSRGLTGKVVPYEESVRVPLIIRPPKSTSSAASRQSAAPVSSLDLPGTLLAMAGVAVPRSWPGRDLRPFLRPGTPVGFDEAIAEWADYEGQFGHYGHRLIRTPNYKLIRWQAPEKPDELYDLKTDRHETRNLALDARLTSVREDLMRRMNAWMERTEDPARGWIKDRNAIPRRITLAGSDPRPGREQTTPVSVDPGTVQAYAGQYELVTRNILTFVAEGGRLFFMGGRLGTSAQGQKVELVAESDNRFLHPTQPLRFTFVRDARGQVSHVVRRTAATTLDTQSYEIPARRLLPQPPDR